MILFETSQITNKTKNKKGKAWIKKTYKNLLFNECSCGNVLISPHKKCPECIEKERIENRTKTCSCGNVFILDDNQNGNVTVCPRCKEADYKLAYITAELYFDKRDPYYYIRDIEERIRKFSSKERNIIQSVTGYPEFKIPIKFESTPDKKPCWDHNNSMTNFLVDYLKIRVDQRKNKIKEFLRSDKKKFEFFKNFLLKYGRQFPTTPEANQELIKYQIHGVTPSQYVGVVGKVVEFYGSPVNKSVEESIEIIKPYFINQD